MEKRLLFLVGCIGPRLLFALLAKKCNSLLPIMGIFGLMIAFGLMYFYFSGSRTSGPETFGDKIWWNDLRPVHAAFYFMFALLALHKSEYAYIPLLIDVSFGLIAYLVHYKNM